LYQLVSSLEHHQRKRQWQTTITFFAVTAPQNKMMTHCHLLLLFRHPKKKAHKKTTKAKPRKRMKLTFKRMKFTFKLLLCPLIYGSRFYPFILMFSPCIFFFSNRRKKKNKGKKKP
jgi:Na+/melibiose symporter-like transporter